MATLKNDGLTASLQHRPARCTDLTHQRFGLLTVVAFSHIKKSGAAYWHCLCDCGNAYITTTNNLHRSVRASCTLCRGQYRREDLTGQRFNRLLVTSTFWKEGIRHIQAQCDCGNLWEGAADNVVQNSTISCGCWRKLHRRKDYTGQLFGLLMVQNIFYRETRTYAQALCTCGRAWEGRMSDLVTGKTTSCGCIRLRTPQQMRDNDRLHYHRYRARKKALPDTFDDQALDFLFHYWKCACAVCGREEGGLFHVLALDHWIPLKSPACPGTVPWNILPLCHAKRGPQPRPRPAYCNNAKQARDPQEWLISKLGPRQAKAKLRAIETYFHRVREMFPQEIS